MNRRWIIFPIIIGIFTSVIEIYLFLFSKFFHLFFPYTTLIFFLISSFWFASLVKFRHRVNIAISLFVLILLIYIIFIFLSPLPVKRFISSLQKYEYNLLLIYPSSSILFVWRTLTELSLQRQSMNGRKYLSLRRVDKVQFLLIWSFVLPFLGYKLYLDIISNNSFLTINQCFFFACFGLVVIILFKFTVFKQLLLLKDIHGNKQFDNNS